MSTPDLSSGPAPTNRRPPPHETTEAECSKLGREWVINPQFAAGGYCRADDGNPWPPPVLHLCSRDAGADAAPLGLCADAGQDVEGAR